MTARAKRRARQASQPHRDTAAARYRRKMRSQGLRLVQFWAPDVNAPGFAAESRRQSRLAAARKADEREILAEVEGLSAEVDLGPAPAFVMPGREKGK